VIRRLIVLSVVLLGLPLTCQAQAHTYRWDLALLAPAVRFVDLDPSTESFRQQDPRVRQAPLATWWEAGSGIRLGYRVTQHLGAEVELSGFGRYANTGLASRGAQGLVQTGYAKGGVVAGPVVRKRFGAFTLLAKARPGFIRFLGFPAIFGVSVGQNSALVGESTGPAAFLAMDVGGGVEWNLSRRVFVRGDLGDTMVRYRPTPHDLNPTYWRHNVQTSLSAAFRF
jgi:hypothetical protein